MILNPNCSELVVRLPCGVSKEDIERELNKIGIYITDKIYNWWDFHEKDSEEGVTEGTFFDVDNPNSPDFTNTASMHLSYNGSWEDGERHTIVAHQHCQHQLFQTLRKIEKHFDVEIEGYDGGSTTDYEDWVGSGEVPIENYNKEHIKRRVDIIKNLPISDDEKEGLLDKMMVDSI